jgi:hypothetical protein
MKIAPVTRVSAAMVKTSPFSQPCRAQPKLAMTLIATTKIRAPQPKDARDASAAGGAKSNAPSVLLPLRRKPSKAIQPMPSSPAATSILGRSSTTAAVARASGTSMMSNRGCPSKARRMADVSCSADARPARTA